YLGRQELLHAAAHRSAGRGERRRAVGRPSRQQPIARFAQATAPRANRGQSVLPRGVGAHARRGRRPRRRPWHLPSGEGARHHAGARHRAGRARRADRSATAARQASAAVRRRDRQDRRADLLETVAEMAALELRRGLAQLQAAEFLYETSLFPELEYTFKRALPLEVAYQTLPRERRRPLPAGVLAALEARPREQTPASVEVLAHHAVRAESWQPAAAYLYRAGAKA